MKSLGWAKDALRFLAQKRGPKRETETSNPTARPEGDAHSLSAAIRPLSDFRKFVVSFAGKIWGHVSIRGIQAP